MQGKIRPILNVSLKELKLIIDESVLPFRSIDNSFLLKNYKKAQELTHNIFIDGTSWDERLRKNKLTIRIFDQILNEMKEKMFFSLDYYNNTSLINIDRRFYIIFNDDKLIPKSRKLNIRKYENDLDNDYDIIQKFTSKLFCYKLIVMGLESFPNLIYKNVLSINSDKILNYKNYVLSNYDCTLTFKFKVPSIAEYINSIIYINNDNFPLNVTKLFLN